MTNENIVNFIENKYTYNDKIVNNNIYIIIDTNMKNNFYNNKITQFFTNCTFYCLPPQSKGMCLF